MIHRTENSILIEKTVAAEPADLFVLLTDPRRHADVDGSGMVRAAAGSARIERVGDVFTMEMSRPDEPRYRTDNHVVDFEPGRRIAWTTGREGEPPAGVVWSWEFAAAGPGRTRVAHTYDWSGVTDPGVLARVTFPRVSAEQMRATIDRLADLA